MPRRDRNFLPPAARRFTGRLAEIERLDELIAAEPDALVCGIDGMAGVGKTTFAVRVARDLTSRYPDGQFFVDLQGYSVGGRPLDPVAALAVLLRQAGVPGEQIPGDLPERAARWRAELSGRRALVVLDNAITEDQVRPLVPDAPGCLTLITSRRRLTGLDEAVPFSLGTLASEDAEALFASVSGVDPSDRALGEIVRRCAHLPLAIRIAAARLRHRPAWTTADLLHRLQDPNILAQLGSGEQSVVTAFEMSYGQIPPDQRRAFRLLGIQPMATFDSYAASALLDVTVTAADRLLEELLDAHLVEQSGADRYRFHDLVRLHAREVADADEAEVDRRAAIRRLLDYLLHVAVAATRVLDPHRRDIKLVIVDPPGTVPPVGEGDAAAMGWLETERTNLLAAIEFAVGNGWDGHAWQLARAYLPFFDRGGYPEDWIASHELALVAARRAADPLAEAITTNNLALVFRLVGRLGEGRELALRSLEIFIEHGDALGLAVARCGLGQFHRLAGEYPEAERCFTEAITALPDDGSAAERQEKAVNQHNLAMIYERTGRYDDARRLYTAALDIFISSNDRTNQTLALRNLGVLHARLGDHPSAMACLTRSLAITRESGDRSKEGRALGTLGALYLQVDRPEDAVECLIESLAALQAVDGKTDRVPVLANLGVAYSRLARYDEAAEHHREAIELAVELGAADLEAEILNDTGETHFLIENIADSRRCHEEALRIADRIGLRHEADRSRHRLSLLATC